MKYGKKILCASLAMSMCAFLSMTSSIAYLQSHDREVNKFTVDSNESEIVETFTKPSSLAQGTVINKEVKVKNTGNVPCYVRVLVLPTSNPDSFQLNTSSTTDNVYSSSKEWYHVDGWDNYYYYKKVLQPGETTSALFSTITITSDLTGLSSEDAQIIVYEETNQSEGYSNALDAFK